MHKKKMADFQKNVKENYYPSADEHASGDEE